MSLFIAELVGTMILIVLGDGVVANVVLNKTKGHNSGWIVITTGCMRHLVGDRVVELGIVAVSGPRVVDLRHGEGARPRDDGCPSSSGEAAARLRVSPIES